MPQRISSLALCTGFNFVRKNITANIANMNAGAMHICKRVSSTSYASPAKNESIPIFIIIVSCFLFAK